ncbi:hypothetical protein NSK_003089 [Nannochloropsis salina CCMP1776]|uniref:Kinetochore protein Spc24 n=1 Tax=Nannochloropsis salina CCMP1776 TaxID=1027361 RepID=A0A4D9D2C3_9STRA|nr:hypothetical protein NSK_003089 [Nannochloropsis salina CCMP1776]|eukprot:TFJ85580.1 hypothetical protein NSK_003089 [Nannochloropsis salina CCMP1776]
MTWEETRSIMSEVQELFAGREDTNTIEEIRELQREIKDTVQSREAGAATCIRGLTAEVNVSQAAVDALPAAEEADKSRKAALEGEKGETEEVLVAMNKKIADTRQNVECMKVEAEEVEEKAKGIEHASQDQAPRVLHALSLYANITGIRWKYDDGEKSHLIRGFVSLPDKEEVREFTLDCHKESSFKIANSIWNMIDP